MASLVCPTWSEVREMDELVLTAINIIKGEMMGDEFVYDYQEENDDGSISAGIWKSTLDKRKKQNSGRVQE